MDFIFIDGGHSIETIQNNWKYSKQLIHDYTVVVFDDFYRDIENLGCKKILDSIDRNEFLVEILQPTDKFKKNQGVLCVNFVKVTKKLKLRKNYENFNLYTRICSLRRRGSHI